MRALPGFPLCLPLGCWLVASQPLDVRPKAEHHGLTPPRSWHEEETGLLPVPFFME